MAKNILVTFLPRTGIMLQEKQKMVQKHWRSTMR